MSEISHLEYETLDGVYWRIDRPDRLLEDFGVAAAEVADWHGVMAFQGRAWEILRRLYQAGPLLDPDEEVLVPWTREEIGKKMGIPKAEVDHEIHHSAEHWRLLKARGEVSKAAKEALAGDDEIDRLTKFSNSAGLDSATVDKLLEAFNFSDVKGDLLRAQVANRILSLREYLESPHSRTSARQLIRLEVSLHAKERMLLVYNNKIEQITEDDPELQVKSSELDGYRTKAKDLDAEIRAITAAHSKLQQEIGADDIDMTTRKRIFVETVAYIMQKCREYESDPATVLLDGVFRADEIDWLLEPDGERVPQYRPDITVRLHDALQPRNLWDTDYKPPKIALRVCQELRKLAECMRAVPEDAKPLPDMEAEGDEGDIGEGMVMPILETPETTAPRVMPQRQERETAPLMGVF